MTSSEVTRPLSLCYREGRKCQSRGSLHDGVDLLAELRQGADLVVPAQALVLSDQPVDELLPLPHQDVDAHQRGQEVLLRAHATHADAHGRRNDHGTLKGGGKEDRFHSTLGGKMTTKNVRSILFH